MDARWWSITAYGKDHDLMPNAMNRFSYNKHNVIFSPERRFHVMLSAAPKVGCWLPTRKGEKISLTLRLYYPNPEIYNHIDTIKLPKIIKLKYEGWKNEKYVVVDLYQLDIFFHGFEDQNIPSNPVMFLGEDQWLGRYWRDVKQIIILLALSVNNRPFNSHSTILMRDI